MEMMITRNQLLIACSLLSCLCACSENPQTTGKRPHSGDFSFSPLHTNPFWIWRSDKKTKTLLLQRDSLSSLRLPEDHYAYAYAVLLEQYCVGNDVFESESMYRLDLAMAHYKYVLEKYPDSDWADDAACALLIIDTYSSCEGGCFYTQENVNALERFVEKHPASNKIPEVWLAIANVCLNNVYVIHNQQVKTIPTARELGYGYLKKVTAQYPEFASNEQYTRLLEAYQRKAVLF